MGRADSCGYSVIRTRPMEALWEIPDTLFIHSAKSILGLSRECGGLMSVGKNNLMTMGIAV